MERLKSIIDQTGRMLELQSAAIARLDRWIKTHDLPAETEQQWHRLCVIQDVLRQEHFRALLKEADELRLPSKESAHSEVFRELLSRLAEKPRPQSLLEGMMRGLSADSIVLLECVEESGLCRPVAWSPETASPSSPGVPFSTGACGCVLRSGQTLLIPDARQLKDESMPEPRHRVVARSVIAAPLRIRNQIAGILCLERTEKTNGFTEADKETVEALLPLVRMLFFAAPRMPDSAERRGEVFVERKRALSGLIGESADFRTSVELARRAAESSRPVLLSGEHGTGKRLLASAIHTLSERHAGPFVACKCAGLDPELLNESLDAAVSGTLFLEEVAGLPKDIQLRLEAVLEDSGEVRVIAATAADLERKVAEGSFEGKLFDMLREGQISISPLRKRPDDIGPLARHMFGRISFASDSAPAEVVPEVFLALEGYRFPGNVTELKEIVRQALLAMQNNKVTLGSLPAEVRPASVSETEENPFWNLVKTIPEQYSDLAVRKEMLKQICRAEIASLERRFAEALIERSDGNVTRAAKLAGIDRAQFHRLLKSRPD